MIHRISLLSFCVILTWLVVTIWPVPVVAQMRAMPPSIAEPEPPVPEGRHRTLLPGGTDSPTADDFVPTFVVTDEDQDSPESTVYGMSPTRAPSSTTPEYSDIGPVATSVPGGRAQWMNVDTPHGQMDGPTFPGYPWFGQFSGGFLQSFGTESWTWQMLPEGLIYRSYLANPKGSRLATKWVHERKRGWISDSTVGGHVGLIRYGTQNPLWPEGWQLDVEGAAFPRLSVDRDRDLVSVDFRAGVPLSFRRGTWETKFGYYHISSHLGDEYMVTFPAAHRVNYVRDSLVLGLSLWPDPELRLYAEADWAFYTGGGAKPWQFQIGIDYAPAEPNGFRGGPFAAVNGWFRQETNFACNLTAQLGWAWRGRAGSLFRVGGQFYTGKSEQYQFASTYERQAGFGMWYDF